MSMDTNLLFRSAPQIRDHSHRTESHQSQRSWSSNGTSYQGSNAICHWLLHFHLHGSRKVSHVWKSQLRWNHQDSDWNTIFSNDMKLVPLVRFLEILVPAVNEEFDKETIQTDMSHEDVTYDTLILRFRLVLDIIKKITFGCYRINDASKSSISTKKYTS